MDNRKNTKKKVIVTVFVCIIVCLGLLFVISEALPHIVKLKPNNNTAEFETKIFYDAEKITEADLSVYDTLVKDIYYKTNGAETLIDDGKYYEVGGYEAVLFGKYIEAIKNGDNISYAECFDESFDFDGDFGRFAKGDETFPPQRLYDIHIEELDRKYEESLGLCAAIFSVSYRIYLNTGDFRTDITEDTAPLIFVTMSDGQKAKITDIFYRYQK